MSICVDFEVFSFLTDRLGKTVGEDEGPDLRDWWSKETNFVGVTYLPGFGDSWSDKFLDDWGQLNDWWEGFVSYDKFDVEDPNDKPRRIFPTRESVFEYLLENVRRSPTDKYDVGYVEITHNQNSIFLIYTDFDSWTLSSGNFVSVVGTLDELTEDQGYY